MNDHILLGRTPDQQSKNSEHFLHAIQLAKSIGLDTTRKQLYEKPVLSYFFQKIKSSDMKFLGSRIRRASAQKMKSDFDYNFEAAFQQDEDFNTQNLAVTMDMSSGFSPQKSYLTKTHFLGFSERSIVSRPKTSINFPKQIVDLAKSVSRREAETVRMNRLSSRRENQLKNSSFHQKKAQAIVKHKKAILKDIVIDRVPFCQDQLQKSKLNEKEKLRSKKTQRFYFNRKNNRFQFRNPVISYDTNL